MLNYCNMALFNVGRLVMNYFKAPLFDILLHDVALFHVAL